MSRTRVQKTEEDIVRTTRREMSKEKADLLDSPDRRPNPKYDKDEQINWKAYEKTRANVIDTINDMVTKAKQALEQYEEEMKGEDIDLSRLYAMYSEITKHSTQLFKAIDAAAGVFFDPNENKKNQPIEIRIRHE
jgi:hypothetical protein